MKVNCCTFLIAVVVLSFAVGYVEQCFGYWLETISYLRAILLLIRGACVTVVTESAALLKNPDTPVVIDNVIKSYTSELVPKQSKH
jgi:hypothetical protein